VNFDPTALRRCVLAVSVLDDVDVLPNDDGVTIDPGVLVTWDEVCDAIGPADPESPVARARLGRWIHLRTELAQRPSAITHLRPLGLPVGHDLHPGMEWVQDPIRGNSLHLGAGVIGLEDDPDEVTVAPAGLLGYAGVNPRAWWRREGRGYLEEMGAVAAVRLRREPDAPLRPMGDCDVVTLLGSVAFRIALSKHNGVGMRAAAVPMRRRGWVDPDHLDAAFAQAAAWATNDDERGFIRPVLVTPDGVWIAREGFDPSELPLRDVARPDPKPWADGMPSFGV
jgi:hypothetical protein